MPVLILLFLFLTLPSTLDAKRPHIVIIMADDLGWSDVGYRDPEMVTPNIDRLASEGVVMDSMYMQRICTPSRAAFLSGLYPFRLGMQHTSLYPSENNSLPLDKRLFPQDLQDKGYKTHLVGKWHLGFCKPEMTPTYRGFDSFYGTYNGMADHFTHISRDNGYDLQFNRGRGDATVFSADRSVNGTYSTDLLTKRAVRIITKHGRHNPLFLFLSYQAAHAPVQVPDRHKQTCAHVTSQVRGRQKHCAMTAAMDEGIGRVMEALKDRGLTDNLITLFTSDNGGHTTYGSSNWPLRGAKSSNWEGGTRVVSILHSKSHLPRNHTWNGLMHAVDWYPTLLKAAGINDVDTSHLDGVNNWWKIKSNKPSKRTEFVYNINEVKRNYALRWNQYKLVSFNRPEPKGWYNPPPGNHNIPESDTIPKDRPMLFDLDQDPVEQNDLGGLKKYEHIVQMMTNKLDAYKAQLVPTKKKVKLDAASPKYHDGLWVTGWC